MNIIDKNIYYSYGSLDYYTDLYYSKLNKVNKGSVVAIISDYSFYSIALFFALVRNNNIIVPIVNEYNIGSKLVDSHCEYVIKVHGDEINITGFYKPSHELIENLRALGDPGLILFSSGTTGTSKVILYNLKTLLSKYTEGVSRGSVYLVFLMFDHMGGLNTLLHCLSLKETIVIPEYRNPYNICNLIDKYKVTVLPTSPTFLNLLLISEAYKHFDLSSLQLITYGSEPMPESLLERLKSVFNVKFHQTFGISELGVLKTKSKEGAFIELNEQYKVVDGELWIKSNPAMIGYLNSNYNTEDGWYKTGDIVEEKGKDIKIIGRISDVINVGGVKVVPSEVESLLLKIPEIKDCVVYGEPNLITGQIVAAKVVTSHSNPKKLITEYYKYTEKYKLPVKVISVSHIEYTDRLKKARV